jgi:formate dehydrogenase major subunit/formate dehydrogenase alpha subunit
VVLPAASFAEKGGTFTSFERRVQQVRPAIDPRGESLPDWQVIQRLANKMHYSMQYSSPQEIMDEIREVAPLYQGVDYEVLEMGGGYWPKSNIDRSGTTRLYEGGFPQGFGRFSATEYLPRVEISGNGYPLELLAGGTLYQFGSGARSSRSARLKAMMPEPFVEISETDATELGIGQGERVKVISPIGEVAASARITDALSPGTLFMPVSFAQSPVHELFGITLDPRSKTPLLKSCRVRLEKI